MYQAIIFDMDGVLVDSEPFWQQAELAVFPRYGVELTVADTLKTQGLRIDEVVKYWFDRQPWENPNLAQVEAEILDTMVEVIAAQGQPMPGVMQTLDAIKAAGIPMAVATSSPHRLMETTLKALNIKGYFNATCSAEHLPLGKPHPQVYLNAADALGVAPEHCLAIEDSFNGVIAAKAGRLAVVAIPDADHKQDARFAAADYRFDSLQQFDLERFT